MIVFKIKIKQPLIIPLFFFFIRDELKRHYTLGEYWVEVEMEDLASFDEDLSDCLYKLPTENLTLVSGNQASRRLTATPTVTRQISWFGISTARGSC